MKRLLIAVVLFAAVLPAQAQFQPDPSFERVLVPVYYFGGGALGAQWWTDLNLFTTGPAFDLGRPVLQATPVCEFCGCDATATLPTHRVANVCQQFEDIRGVLLYVPRNVSRDDVHIAARGRDRSRAAERYGTEIPVVWERDLLAGKIVLLDIPTDARYRSSLRVYDAFQWGTRFTVRFFDMAALRRGERTPLVETTIAVRYDVGAGEAGLPLRPAYTIVGDLTTSYPALRGAQSVAIELDPEPIAASPAPPARRLYAIASVTNNTTQEFTIISPR